VPIKHPKDRGAGEQRTRFDEIAEAASNFTSSPVFFGLCVALVVAWAASFALDLNANVRDFLGYAMAALALLLIALLKNAELRSEYAIQRKLDAIATALLYQRRGETEEAQEELERAIGMHDEV
jgi:low affinity Fe/Cu permease